MTELQMTELLYMKDSESNYIREFDATVTSAGEESGEESGKVSGRKYIVLDRSVFYPAGGGQESDTGTVRWEGGIARVREVRKKGDVRHFLEGALPAAGTNVHGTIDWERRYAHMRMHTAQHVISGVVYDMFKARTVGNQIHADKSRVDFAPVSLSESDVRNIETACT
jgi:misacylated tRNA(Ala) deacylase